MRELNRPEFAGLRALAGLAVEVAASAEQVGQATALAFRPDGGLLVTQWRPGETRLQQHASERPGSQRRLIPTSVKATPDALVALHDRDRDGLFETAEPLMDDLALPSGVLVHDGWIYWTSAGRLLRRRTHEPRLAEELVRLAAERQGPTTRVTAGGKWLEQTLVEGLVAAVPCQAAGIAIGSDGWLYLAAGSGDNLAQSWDGSRAAVLRSGTVLRMRPDGARLHEWARGLVAPEGAVACDPLGHVFCLDRGWNADGPHGLRLVHLLEGGDYGWRHIGPHQSTARTGLEGRPDPAYVRIPRPGTLPAMHAWEGDAPGGIAVLAGAAFPRHFEGLLLVANPGRHAVEAFVVQPQGASFGIQTQFDLVAAASDAFRPTQVLQGPDGALYVLDAGPPGNAPRAAGSRILRLRWQGTEAEPAIPLAPLDRWAKLPAADLATLVESAAGADPATRRAAMRELASRAQRGPHERDAVLQQLVTVMTEARHPAAARVAAIWAAASLDGAEVRQTLLDLLPGDQPEVTAAAALALADYPPADPDGLQSAVEAVEGVLGQTRSTFLGRVLRLALGKLAARGSFDAAEWGFEATSVTHGPNMSVYVFDGHVRALELVPGAAKELMLGNLDVAINLPEVEPQERQRLKEFVTLTAEAMRSRELAVFLDALLLGPDDLLGKMDGPLEARLIAAYRNVLVEPPIQADAVAVWIIAHPGGPPEVELAALETLSLVGTRRAQVVEALAERLLSQPHTAAQVAQSLLEGRLGVGLLPRVRAGLARLSQQAGGGELRPLIERLERIQAP